MHPGMHGTTFGGGPLACAVAIEFLRQEKSLLKHIRQMGKYLHTGLTELDKKHSSIQDVRGVGLMLAMELDSADLAKVVTKELLQQGIIINRTHDTVLRFLPPYIIEKKHVDQVIKALDAALYNAALYNNEVTKSGSDTSRSTKSEANLEAKKKEKGTSRARRSADAHA
jgi:acetylornithine aminotransferase/acetylornithine/N-succinyldiaminopimelate aminotransferase